jgi:hypothetical protein
VFRTVRFLTCDVAVERDPERVGLPPLPPPATVLGAGNRVPAPHLIPGARVPCLDEAANAILPSASPHKDLAIHRDHRAVQRISLLIVGDLLLPDLAPVAGVEGDQLGVERPHVDTTIVHRHPSVDRAAAVHGDVEVVSVLPLLRAGRGIQCHDMIQRGGDIHGAVEHYRTRLKGMGNTGLVAPSEL